MSSLSHTFNIRKLSTYKADGTWHHYPQRTDICVHFFKLKLDPAITISTMWKGTTLDRFTFEPTTNVVSVIARFPSIGFKQSDPHGKLIKRFQISFGNQDDYDRCYKCIQDSLKLSIAPADLGEKKISENAWLESMSQILSQTSQSMDIPQHGVESELPEPFEQFASQAQSSSNQVPSVQATSNGQLMTNPVSYTQIPDIQSLAPAIYPTYMPVCYAQPAQQSLTLPEVFRRSMGGVTSELFRLSDQELSTLLMKNLQDESFLSLVQRIDKLIGQENF